MEIKLVGGPYGGWTWFGPGTGVDTVHPMSGAEWLLKVESLAQHLAGYELFREESFVMYFRWVGLPVEGVNQAEGVT